MEYVTRALELERAANDRGTEASTLLTLSKLYFNLREYQKALDQARRSREICRSLGNIQREAFALNHMAIAAHRLSDTETAFQMFRRLPDG
jgi:tetratricopeptide (TPR) repeat protein